MRRPSCWSQPRLHSLQEQGQLGPLSTQWPRHLFAGKLGRSHVCAPPSSNAPGRKGFLRWSQSPRTAALSGFRPNASSLRGRRAPFLFTLLSGASLCHQTLARRLERLYRSPARGPGKPGLASCLLGVLRHQEETHWPSVPEPHASGETRTACSIATGLQPERQVSAVRSTFLIQGAQSFKLCMGVLHRVLYTGKEEIPPRFGEWKDNRRTKRHIPSFYFQSAPRPHAVMTSRMELPVIPNLGK